MWYLINHKCQKHVFTDISFYGHVWSGWRPYSSDPVQENISNSNIIYPCVFFLLSFYDHNACTSLKPCVTHIKWFSFDKEVNQDRNSANMTFIRVIWGFLRVILIIFRFIHIFKVVLTLCQKGEGVFLFLRAIFLQLCTKLLWQVYLPGLTFKLFLSDRGLISACLEKIAFWSSVSFHTFLQAPAKIGNPLLKHKLIAFGWVNSVLQSNLEGRILYLINFKLDSLVWQSFIFQFLSKWDCKSVRKCNIFPSISILFWWLIEVQTVKSLQRDWMHQNKVWISSWTVGAVHSYLWSFSKNRSILIFCCLQLFTI